MSESEHTRARVRVASCKSDPNRHDIKRANLLASSHARAKYNFCAACRRNTPIEEGGAQR